MRDYHGLTRALSCVRTLAAILAVDATLVLPQQPAMAEDAEAAWSVTGYAGPLTFNNTSDIFLEGDFEVDGTMVGAGLNRPILTIIDGRAQVELDATAFARLTDEIDYYEGAGVALARWTDLPWNETFPSSVAIGYGLSYTSDVPANLKEKDENAPRLNGALVAELEVALPRVPQVSGVLRYHHRSAAFGLFGTDGPFDDSTAFLLGLRYRFGKVTN